MYETVLSVLKQHSIEYKENFPLKNISSFKTGGNADLLVSPKSEEEIIWVLKACKEQKIPYAVLGNSTNLLIADSGYRGVILRIGKEFSQIVYKGNGRIECKAGASLASLCNFALKQGLTGLEFAYGIPGTAGGAAYMNAGAYGGEMKDVLVSCTHITPDFDLASFENEDLKLAYRRSVYTDSPYVITSLTLQLREGDPTEIKAKMDDLFGRRKDKQPLDFPSAGSTFKRPVGYFAGGLIEECGLKGYTVGGAQVSEKHAGFVINKGDATTADILQLIRDVQKIVLEKKGVSLETEVKYLG